MAKNNESDDESKLPYYLVQSVDRALLVLELFIAERKPMGVTEVAQQMKLHKSIVHRLLATLEHHGYLEQNTETGKYMVGPKSFELSSVYMNHTSLLEEGKPVLQQLVENIGLFGHLAVLEGSSVLYLANCSAERSAVLNENIGRRTKVHYSALGKSLAAWLPPAELERLLTQLDFGMRTDKTIVTVEGFRRELERVRALGYSVDDEEGVLGARCVAVPVRNYSGQVVAAISVGGTSKQITKERIPELSDLLKEYAARLSPRLPQW